MLETLSNLEKKVQSYRKKTGPSKCYTEFFLKGKHCINCIYVCNKYAINV